MAAEPDGIWSKIGKVSVVLGIIIALIAIVNFIRPNEPRLSCDCRSTLAPTTSIYAGLHQQLDERIRDSMLWSTERKLRDEVPSQLDSATITALAKRVSWPETSQEWLLQLRSDQVVLECLIRNSGRRQATQTLLKLPFEIGGLKKEPQGMPDVTFKANAVDIGTVVPGDSFRLQVWGVSYGSRPTQSEEILLASAEGVGTVRLATDAIGVSATAAKATSLLADSPSFLATLIGLFTLLLLAIRQATLARGYREGYAAAVSEGMENWEDSEKPAHREDGA